METFRLSDKFDKPKYLNIMGVNVKKGWLVLVGGYKGVGKTHWLCKTTKYCRGTKVFLSLELEKEDILMAFSRVYTDEDRANPDNDFAIISQKSIKMSQIVGMFEKPIKEYENQIAKLREDLLKHKMDEVQKQETLKKLDSFKRPNDITPEFVFIDDPVRIVYDGIDAYNLKPYEKEAMIFDTLDKICEKYKCVLITTCQISADFKEKPSSAGFRGSQEKKNLSDVVVILHDNKFQVEHSRAGQQNSEWFTWKENEGLDEGQMELFEEKNEED